MRINRNNYEAFLLDLSEGNLSDELHSELNSFLASNPDLEVELIDDISTFETVNDAFIDKDSLKFDKINESNRKHFFVAYHEEDLDVLEQKEVEQFVLENPSLQKEFDQFSQLCLAPTVETFKDKELLHSIADDSNSRGFFYWSFRVAAILLIGFILNSLYQNSSKITPKYALENGILNFKPSIEQGGEFDITKSKNVRNEINQTNILAKNNIFERKSSFKNLNSTKEVNSNSKEETTIIDFDNIKVETPKINPALDEVIASLNPREPNNENEIVSPLPTKKIKTPPSLLAYLGEKAKKKEILSENGRPNIVSLINKGSKSLTGQDVLAQSQTEESSSTIFQLGSLKIERISKK